MKRPAIVILSFLLLAGAIFILPSQFSAEKRLRAAHASLLDAVRDASRPRMARILADDYKDGWGMNKSEAIGLAIQVNQQFLTLEMEVKGLEMAVTDKTAKTQLTVNLRGGGSAGADAVREKVAHLKVPFVLEWRRESWTPWSWKLVSVTQSEIRLPKE